MTIRPNGDLLFNIGKMTSLKSSLSPFYPDMTLDLYNVADYVEAMCLSVPFQTEAFDHHVSDRRSFVCCTTDSSPGVSLCSCHARYLGKDAASCTRFFSL